MAITFRSSTTNTASSATTIALTKPTGTVSGDYLIAVLGTNPGHATPPTGWLDVTPFGHYIFVEGATPPYGIFAKLAGGSEPSSYTFTSPSSGNLAGLLLCYNAGGYAAIEASAAAGGDSTSLTPPTITFTKANDVIVVICFSIDSASPISLGAGITSRATITGSSTAPSLVAGDYSAFAPAPNITSAGPQTGFNTGTGYEFNVAAVLALLDTAPTPQAPTLSAPANGSYSDLNTTGGPFTWTYNTGGSIGGETAYNFRRSISGGAYSYWNASAGSFQSTDISNTSTALSVTFVAGVWPDGYTYNWSVASTDVGGEGNYASDFTANGQVAPSVSVTNPTGTITTTQYPAVIWTPTLAPQASVLTYRVVTYNSTQYGAGGFSPGVSTGVDDSGVITSTNNTYTIVNPLPTGVSYESYVQLVETPGNQASAWAFSSFTISADTPQTPTIGAAYGTDPSTGCPRIVLTVTCQDNILSANDASFEGGLGTTAAITNCAVAQSATQAEDGTQSCRLTSTASGNMSAGTATGLSGYAVLANTSYTFRSDYRSAVSARSCRTDISWYNSSGTFISTTTGTAHNDTTSGWTTSLTTATSPAGSAFARLIHNVLATGAGSEVHYVDEAGIFPGTVASWSAGGFVGASFVDILRSDGLYVRLASPVNDFPVPTPAQVAIVYDYEVIPGVNYTYQAIVVSGQFASALSSASSAVDVPTGLGWWELDPTNVASAVNAQVTQWNPQSWEQSAAHQVLSQTTGNVVASVMQMPDMAATFEIFTSAIWTALFALMTSQKTVFISDPFGSSIPNYYFRIGPAPGGLSAGTGNQAHDTQLMASTAAGPHRTIAVTAIAQPRPAV